MVTKSFKQRRDERLKGESALTGGVKRQRIVPYSKKLADRAVDRGMRNPEKNYDSTLMWQKKTELYGPRANQEVTGIVNEAGENYEFVADANYLRHQKVAGGIKNLDIEGFVDENKRAAGHDDSWFEDKRFELMGAARALLRAGEETGNPGYSVLGTKIYEKLGVNADNIVRRSLERSINRVQSYEQDFGPNPKFNLDFMGTEPERIKRKIYENETSEKEVLEAREFLAKYEAKHAANTERVMTGILSIVGFSGGVGLLGSQLTGNIVDSASNPTPILKVIGVGLFLLGIISFFVYLRKSKEQI